MDRKEAFDVVLAQIDEDKREEAVARLREAGTRAEKLEILKEYGITINKLEDILGAESAGEFAPLSDEQLASVAGGSDFSWSAECNCE